MTFNFKLSRAYLAAKLFLLTIYVLVNTATAFADDLEPVSLKHLKNARDYVSKGLYEQAKTELEIASKTNPDSPDILNNLGAVYLRLGQSYNRSAGKGTPYLEKARSYFTQALHYNPDFTSAWNGLADTYYLTGNTQQAIFYYKKAISKGPKDAWESQTNLANAQRDLGLLQEAQESYEKAIELNPLYAQAHNGFAELLLSQKQYPRAYSEILEALRQKPNYALAYYNLGLLETARNNKAQACKAYLLSLRYETNPIYAKETQALVDQLRVDPKRISFQDLNNYQSELSHSLSSNAVDSEFSRQAEPSTGSRPTSLAGQNEIDPQVQLGKIKELISQHKLNTAKSQLNKLLTMYPDEPVLLNELGLMLMQEKNYPKAKQAFEKAIKYSNGNLTAAFYNLGKLYLSEENLAKAKPLLEKAITLSKNDYESSVLINNALAVLYRLKNNALAAQKHYIAALKADKNNRYPVIHYNYGILLEQMNKKEEAENEFSAYLRLCPKGINALKAEKHLSLLQKP